jgi:hypothetical protein
MANDNRSMYAGGGADTAAQAIREDRDRTYRSISFLVTDSEHSVVMKAIRVADAERKSAGCRVIGDGPSLIWALTQWLEECKGIES